MTAGLSNAYVAATYETTWNHSASITNALGNVVTFAYYPSGNHASLVQTAIRPGDRRRPSGL
jgi:hypothetical protein